MKKVLTLASIALLPLGSLQAADYNIDPSHTYVNFSVSHLGFSTLHGRFNQQSGTLKYDPSSKTAEVSIEIDAASIDTGHGKRDEHLRSPDFLNAVENPTITFTSTNVTWSGDKPATVSGNLTILGVSKPVTLKIEALKCGEHPFMKKPTCGFDATGSVKRSDFGVTYGVPNIGDVLNLKIGVEAVQG